MRRWIKVSVAVAAVLGLGGWIAQPYVHEWWLIRGACDGVLPDDAVRDLVPDDSRVTDTGSGGVKELGDYGCTVTVEGDHSSDWRLLVLEAYTGRDDQDREFMWTFPESGFAAQAAMPEGLPGFVGRYGALEFLLTCPDLGKDADGRQRRMMVRASVGRNGPWRQPATYEVAVAFVNSASERLGCGAKPLKAPKGVSPADPEEDDPKTVPLAAARDTACGWLADAKLPNPAHWKLEPQLTDAAPTGRCEVSIGDDLTDGGPKGMDFVAWFGDWSNRLVAGNTTDRPALTASARCAGEAAHFALDASEDIPGVDASKKRALLEAFAKEQAERRDCTGVRVNG
ncbi:hypothetical protein [Streptomyces sp. A012304]|uniref:hypothetical protein n=1 Tax=Streptomyces sp. A012304 TaxID=375446 RepID=UPI0022319145|nr:hypothetical protein [Streptomyces sp. A012304]GKQ39341.1 hypothetical protein ALMP_58680 [Streptomyces sp. A012304]